MSATKSNVKSSSKNATAMVATGAVVTPAPVQIPAPAGFDPSAFMAMIESRISTALASAKKPGPKPKQNQDGTPVEEGAALKAKSLRDFNPHCITSTKGLVKDGDVVWAILSGKLQEGTVIGRKGWLLDVGDAEVSHMEGTKKVIDTEAAPCMVHSSYCFASPDDARKAIEFAKHSVLNPLKPDVIAKMNFGVKGQGALVAYFDPEAEGNFHTDRSGRELPNSTMLLATLDSGGEGSESDAPSEGEVLLDFGVKGEIIGMPITSGYIYDPRVVTDPLTATVASRVIATKIATTYLNAVVPENCVPMPKGESKVETAQAEPAKVLPKQVETTPIPGKSGGTTSKPATAAKPKAVEVVATKPSTETPADAIIRKNAEMKAKADAAKPAKKMVVKKTAKK